MNNMLRLAADDVRRLFSNVVSIIITLGLVVLPSIFTWYNVLACWNVFDNTDKLTVAVANTDEGYSSNIMPIAINLGDQVVSVLRASDKMNWAFVDEEEALDGARAGRYYAAVVIPEDFSKAMFTFFEKDSDPAKIIYYTNEKKNAIAPKLTDQSTNSMSYEVNQVFAEVLTETAAVAAQKMTQLMDDPYVQQDITVLIENVRDSADTLDSFAVIAGSFQAILNSSHGLLDSAAQLAVSVDNHGQNLTNALVSTTDPITSVGEGLQASVDDLAKALSANTEAYDSLIASVEEFFDSAEVTQESAAEVLNKLSQNLYNNARYYDDVASYLSTLAYEVPDKLPTENAELLEKLQNQLLATSDKIYEVSSTIEALAASLESAVPSADPSADNPDVMLDEKTITEKLEEVKNTVEQTQATFDDKVQTALASLGDKTSAMTTKLDTMMSTLNTTVGDLNNTLTIIDSGATIAEGKLADASAAMSDSAAKMREGADNLEAALASGQNPLLQSMLQSNITTLASFASSPVSIERTAVFPVDNFGSAMSPFYSSLALFIGALLILVALKPQPCAAQKKLLPTLTPSQSYLGHFAVFTLVSLMQSTLMALGNLFFLEVQCMHPFLYLLCYWVTGLVFTFIIYTLTVSFANLGKAIAVIMLIVQVTGCGGSFPLQILPGYVQAISPYLPATHAVDAMRAAMMGIYANDFWIALGQLCLFVLPMLLLGLILRRPLEKFMEWFLEKVESSKLIG